MPDMLHRVPPHNKKFSRNTIFSSCTDPPPFKEFLRLPGDNEDTKGEGVGTPCYILSTKWLSWCLCFIMKNIIWNLLLYLCFDIIYICRFVVTGSHIFVAMSTFSSREKKTVVEQERCFMVDSMLENNYLVSTHLLPAGKQLSVVRFLY